MLAMVSCVVALLHRAGGAVADLYPLAPGVLEMYSGNPLLPAQNRPTPPGDRLRRTKKAVLLQERHSKVTERVES